MISPEWKRDSYFLFWVSKVFPSCNWWVGMQSQKTFIMLERVSSLRRMGNCLFCGCQWYNCSVAENFIMDAEFHDTWKKLELCWVLVWKESNKEGSYIHIVNFCTFCYCSHLSSCIDMQYLSLRLWYDRVETVSKKRRVKAPSHIIHFQKSQGLISVVWAFSW